MIRKFYHYNQLVGTTEVPTKNVVLTKVVEKPKYRYSHVDAEWTKITSDPTPTKSDTEVSLDTLFEDLERIHSSARAGTDNYPPHNIVKIDEEKFLIELAVAGFKLDDIDIELKDGILKVKGEVGKDEREYAF